MAIVDMDSDIVKGNRRISVNSFLDMTFACRC